MQLLSCVHCGPFVEEKCWGCKCALDSEGCFNLTATPEQWFSCFAVREYQLSTAVAEHGMDVPAFYNWSEKRKRETEGSWKGQKIKWLEHAKAFKPSN